MSRPLVGLFAIAALILSWVPASDAQLQNALGNCKYYTKTQQDFYQGLPYCEQCITDDPENPEARYFGAWCLAEVGQYDKAWESFKWLIDRKNDKDKKVQKHAKWAAERVQAYFARHFNKGVEYLNANDLPSAKDEFESATEINPTKPEAYLNLGYVENQMGRSDQALRAFKRAIEIAPDNATAYEYYSVALGRKRDALLAEARPDTAAIAEVSAELKKTLDRVVAQSPENDAALLQLGDLEMAAGNEDVGLAHVEKAIAIAPDNVVKLYNIAVGFYQRNEYEKAANTFGLVAKHVDDPEDDLWRDAQYNRTLALKEAKKPQEALEVALQLLTVDPGQADYHSLISGIYVEMKDLVKAAEHAERAEALKSAAVEGTAGGAQ